MHRAHSTVLFLEFVMGISGVVSSGNLLGGFQRSEWVIGWLGDVLAGRNALGSGATLCFLS